MRAALVGGGGLRTRDVDLLRRRLLVRRAVVEVGSDLVPGTPKTHRMRDVPLPPWLADPLAQHLGGRSADDLVFTNTTGGLLRSANWKRRVWDRALSETGLEPLTPHDLRRTCASLAISNGASRWWSPGCSGTPTRP